MSNQLPRLSFGVVLPLKDGMSRQAMKAFCQSVAARAGIELGHQAFSSPEDLAQALSEGSVQLGWLSPTLLLMSELLKGAVPLLSTVREGAASYHAVLFTLEGSPYRRPEELSGARVAWGPRSSASGYIFPRISLARRGLDPRRLFSEEIFCESHRMVCRALERGEADVGATYAVFEDGDPRRPVTRAGFSAEGGGLPARVLDAAGPIPSDLFVAAPSVPAPQRDVLRAAILATGGDMVAKSSAMILFGAEGFLPFSSDALLELGSLLQRGRELGAIEG